MRSGRCSNTRASSIPRSSDVPVSRSGQTVPSPAVPLLTAGSFRRFRSISRRCVHPSLSDSRGSVNSAMTWIYCANAPAFRSETANSFSSSGCRSSSIRAAVSQCRSNKDRFVMLPPYKGSVKGLAIRSRALPEPALGTSWNEVKTELRAIQFPKNLQELSTRTFNR